MPGGNDEGDPKHAEVAERNRESYLRWQELALGQLGNTITILLAFAGAALNFGLGIMRESDSVLPYPARCFFHGGLFSTALSIMFAGAAHVTRAKDYQYSRRAAHSRWKGAPS